uniref:Organic solvent tolerance-like N-terminal domain-containing protein n=1 Tax=candidate division WOR-3 bacterium TaxID=2052148 RepID=A0A7C4GEI4_UNCW3
MTLNTRSAVGGLLFLLLVQAGFGAELYARKMAIERTPEGQATVFRDSVEITDGDTRLFSRLARVYDSRGLAKMSDSVFISSPDGLVWADSATYRMAEKEAELFGNVRLQQESLFIKAPRLTYSTRERRAQAPDGLEIENADRTYRLTGRRGTYDLDGGVGVVDAEPVLRRAREADSVEVVGRRMSWFENGAMARADGDVVVRSGVSMLRCDTALFFPQADSGVVWGSPEVQDLSGRGRDSSKTAGRATGDTMTFRLSGGALRQVSIVGRAEGRYLTEGGDEVFVKGARIRMWLDGQIDRVEVTEMTSGQLVRRATAGGQE